MTQTEVVIVGGGPVGLFLGCRLAQLTIDFKLLEARTEPLSHSRSIGIHPPSLERLETLGVAQTMIEKGVQVRGGYAFANDKPLGYLSFETCPEPYTFVLALPQYKTERILEKRLNELAPGAVKRGVKVKDLEQTAKGVTVTTSGETIHSALIVGCDGKNSAIRGLANLSFKGHSYPDTYIMGDFTDNTDFGTEAAIYLTDEGLIESFPLPGNVRRWVVKTDAYVNEPSTNLIAEFIQERLGLTLPQETNTMLSSFGVQHYLAENFIKGKIFLAGDAAHVLSPIGGQGMNLGWLDAWSLAEKLKAILRDKQSLKVIARAFNDERQRAARKAARRAKINMIIGRKTRLAQLKYGVVKGVLHTPLKNVLARVFTMRWL